jgi:hypothetical protein
MRTEQDLVTGWKRHVDVADSMLRRFAFHLAALDAAFRFAGCRTCGLPGSSAAADAARFGRAAA